MQKFSLSVAKIELFYAGTELFLSGAIGTAFFYRLGEDVYLITNWHNLTGFHPETKKSLHSQGLIPNTLRVFYKKWTDTRRTAVHNCQIDLPLYTDNHANWYEHSSRAEVDVVALPFAAPDDWANLCVNDIDQEERLLAEAGMDCFIIGFPEGLHGVAYTPIWKRGSIAAEPHRQQPYLIDSATRRGMSGSPVIIRHSGFLGFGDGRMTGDDVIGTTERFVAIYSGRVGDDELGGQLGRAWRKEVLDDILTLATRGEHPVN